MIEKFSTNLEPISPMSSDYNFSDITCLKIIDPTALATVCGWRPKFFRAEHSATAEGEKCGYGPTLSYLMKKKKLTQAPFFFQIFKCHMYKFLNVVPQDLRTTFKPNLTCIFQTQITLYCYLISQSSFMNFVHQN